MTPSAQSYSRRAPAEVTCMLTCEPPHGPSAMTGVGLVVQPAAARLIRSASEQAGFLTFVPCRVCDVCLTGGPPNSMIEYAGAAPRLVPAQYGRMAPRYGITCPGMTFTSNAIGS